jgi:quercetin dioxygenase-like cupin family protein
VWTHVGDDLNINVVHWPAGGGVAEHVNHEVEVLIVGVVGQGQVTISGQLYAIGPSVLVVIPKGTPRSIQSRSPSFAYLSIHRRRAGLWPT